MADYKDINEVGEMPSQYGIRSSNKDELAGMSPEMKTELENISSLEGDYYETHKDYLGIAFENASYNYYVLLSVVLCSDNRAMERGAQALFEDDRI